jgi:hypothetical protein
MILKIPFAPLEMNTPVRLSRDHSRPLAQWRFDLFENVNNFPDYEGLLARKTLFKEK